MARRRTLWIIGLGASIGLLWSLLWATPWGVRLLLNHGVRVLAPAGWTLKFGSVEGSLASQIVVSDFEVVAGRRRVIEGEALTLNWSLGSWSGVHPSAELHLGRLEVTPELIETVRAQPRATAVPAQTLSLGYNGQIGFDFHVGLRISRLLVPRSQNASTAIELADVSVDVEHSVDRSQLACELRVGASSQAYMGQRLRSLSVELSMSRAGLVVPQLAIEVDDGQLRLEDLHLDGRGRVGRMGGLDFTYARAAFADLTPWAPKGNLEVSFAGQGASYTGQVHVPGYLSLDVQHLHSEIVVGQWPDIRDARGGVDLGAQLLGKQARANWHLTHTAGQGRPESEVRVALANHQLVVRLTHGPNRNRRLHGTISSGSLAELAALGPGPRRVSKLDGQVDADFDCRLAASGRPEHCEFACTLVEGAPVERLNLAGSFEYSGANLEFTIEDFEAQVQGTNLALLRPPSVIAWDQGLGQVSSPGLAMAFVREGRRGKLEFKGIYRGPLDSELELELRGLNLKLLRHWLPGGISGIVDVDLQARGSVAAPHVSLSASVTGARWVRARSTGSLPQAWRARRLQVDADYTEQSGHVDARAVGLSADDLALERAHLGLTLGRGGTKLIFEADGRAQLRAAMTARLPVVLGSTKPTLELRPDETLNAELELTGVDLKRLPKLAAEHRLKGRVAATLALAGTLRQPTADLQLRALGLGAMGASIGQVMASLKFVSAGQVGLSTDIEIDHPTGASAEIHAQLPVQWTWSRGRGAINYVRASALRLQVQFARISSRILRSWGETAGAAQPGLLAQVRGSGEGQFELGGTGLEPTFEAWLRWRDLTYRSTALGDSLFTARFGKGQLALDWVQSQGPRVRIAGTALVPVALDTEAGRLKFAPLVEHRANVDIYDLQANDLRPWIASNQGGLEPWLENLTGDVNLSLRGHALDYEIAATFAGQSDYATQSDTGPWPIAAHLRVAPRNQSLTMNLGMEHLAGARIQLATRAKLSLDDVARWPQRIRTSNLEGKIRVPRFSLANFSGMLPPEIHGLSGFAQADVEITGTPAVPRWQGQFSVTGTRFTAVPWRQQIEGLELRGRLRDRSLELQRIYLESGRGRVEGHARFDLEGSEGGKKNARIDLKIAELDIHRAGRAALNVNGRLQGHYVDQGTSRKLRLALHEPVIRTLESKQAPPKSIPTSKAIRFTDGRSRADREDMAEAEVDEVPLDFEVDLVDPLKLEGGRIQMTWQGTLAGRRVAGETQVHGDIAASEGHFELLGRRFEIENGSISITKGKSVRPYVDITAVTRVRGKPITARIHGTRGHMQLQLSTREQASESEILHLLLTGRNDDRALAEAGTATLLSSLSSTAVSRRIRKAARLDSLGLGFGDSLAEPVLYVGKQLTRKLHAEARYHHGADQKDGENQAELRLRYQFNPEWRLEGHSGTARSGGLELLWQRQFDRALTKKP